MRKTNFESAQLPLTFDCSQLGGLGQSNEDCKIYSFAPKVSAESAMDGGGHISRRRDIHESEILRGVLAHAKKLGW